MNHLGTQYLETERLILRKFVFEDAELMYKNWASDDEVTKYLTWPAHDDVFVTQSILKEWIDMYAEEEYYQWAIVLKENGSEPIGCIGANSCNDNTRTVHIGYCIGKEWWNKGITSEALKCVIDFFINKVGMNRVESMHDPKNPNSGAVMKKCGMKYEGTLRQSDKNNQGICDACYYSILGDEI